MMLPRLFELAAKSVAQGIDNHKIPLNFHLNSKSSNLVFRELLVLNPSIIQQLCLLPFNFSITEVDLRNVKIYKEDVESLQLSYLSSLSLGMLSDEFPRNFGVFDILSFLKTALNEESQRELIHLGLSGKEMFTAGWEEEISQLLPSLQSIDISSKIFSEIFRFSNFCASLPNLRILDISNTYLRSLKGISNLRNLQKLVMCHTNIELMESYRELSELKSLKYWDVSCVKPLWLEDARGETEPPIIIASLLIAGVQMPQLEFLDCSGTSVTKGQLELFVEAHPRLEIVVSIQTESQHTTIPGVRLLNFANISSFAQTLKYCTSTKKTVMKRLCVWKMQQDLEGTTILEESTVREYLRILCNISHGSDKDYDKTAVIYALSSILSRGYLKMLSSTETTDLVIAQWKNFDCTPYYRKFFTEKPLIFDMFEGVIKSVVFGKILPTELILFMIEKTILLCREHPTHSNRFCEILRRIENLMSFEQHAAISDSVDWIEPMFKFSEELFDRKKFENYSDIMKLISGRLSQSERSRMVVLERSLTFDTLIDQFWALEKYTIEDVHQVEILKTMTVLMYSMSYDMLQECYTWQVVKQFSDLLLNEFISQSSNGGWSLVNKSFQISSILSFVVTKDILFDRQTPNKAIEKFCHWWKGGLVDPFGLYITEEHIKMALSSKDKTNGTVWWGLIAVDLLKVDSESIWKSTVEAISKDKTIRKDIRELAR